MVDGFKVDMTEVNQLAADLGTVSSTAGGFLRKAISVTAGKVKEDSANAVGSRKHFKQAASAIDYEITATSALTGSQIDAEIGYNRSKATGKLGNLIEYGAPNAKAHFLIRKGGKLIAIPVPGGRSAPLPPGNELRTALDKNKDDFEFGLSEALKDAEHGAGF